jgi:hypothetical protein
VKGATLKTWQFWTWAVCVTLGFACLLLDRMWLFAGMLCLSASSWVLISREQYLAPVPRKQVVWILVAMTVFGHCHRRAESLVA